MKRQLMMHEFEVEPGIFKSIPVATRIQTMNYTLTKTQAGTYILTDGNTAVWKFTTAQEAFDMWAEIKPGETLKVRIENRGTSI